MAFSQPLNAPVLPSPTISELASAPILRFKLANPPDEPLEAATRRSLDPALRQAAEIEAAEDDPQRELRAAKVERRRIWDSIWNEPDLSLDDLLPHRIKTAYRLVREIARTRSLVSDDETLLEALEPIAITAGEPGDSIDPWIEPFGGKSTALIQKNPLFGQKTSKGGRFSPKLVEILDLVNQLPVEDQMYVLRFAAPVQVPGLPLLPPNPPLRSMQDLSNTLETYDPNDDLLLLAYVEALKAASFHLHIDLGSQDDPESGRYGLVGLLDPDSVRAAMPSRTQLLVWEQIFVDEALDLMIREGIPETRRILKKKYGLQEHEITSAIKMASVMSRKLVESDIEEQRSIMILRLEDAARRSKAALDLRAELAALKNLAIVQGLARVEADNVLNDFINIVRAGHDRKFVTNSAIDSPELPE